MIKLSVVFLFVALAIVSKGQNASGHLPSKGGGSAAWISTPDRIYLGDTTKFVGIGTAFPQTTLQINGSFQNLFYYPDSSYSAITNGHNIFGNNQRYPVDDYHLPIDQYVRYYRSNKWPGYGGLQFGDFSTLGSNKKICYVGLWDFDNHCSMGEFFLDTAINSYWGYFGAANGATLGGNSYGYDTLSKMVVRDTGGIAMYSIYGKDSSILMVNSPVKNATTVIIYNNYSKPCMAIKDGKQGDGNLLSGDADGNVSWQTIAAWLTANFSKLPKYNSDAAAGADGLTKGNPYVNSITYALSFKR